MSVHQSPEYPPVAAQRVIDFWFVEAGRERWFVKDAAFDDIIRRRFAGLREAVVASDAEGWRDALEPLLAAILLTDQFSRNIHRGSARAFEADPLALELANEALEREWTHTAPHAWRQFLLTPLMHSECLADQEKSVAEFERLGDPEALAFAVRHHDQIVRFGRFPGRNAALGRESTEAEREVIERGEVF